MPLVKVIRKGVTPSVRKVPTSTAAVMLPMTLNKVGKEAASENEELSRVEDVNDAFAKFKPELNFKGSAGPEETEFKAEFKFKSIKDFDPENLQKRQEMRDEDGKRSDTSKGIDGGKPRGTTTRRAPRSAVRLHARVARGSLHSLALIAYARIAVHPSADLTVFRLST